MGQDFLLVFSSRKSRTAFKLGIGIHLNLLPLKNEVIFIDRASQPFHVRFQPLRCAYQSKFHAQAQWGVARRHFGRIPPTQRECPTHILTKPSEG